MSAQPSPGVLPSGQLPSCEGTLDALCAHPDAVRPDCAGPDDLATGTDVVNTRDGQKALPKHRSTGVTACDTIPTGQACRAAAGWSVLTMDGTGALHVPRTVDGPLTAR